MRLRVPWLELWATQSSGSCPCLWREVGMKWSLRSPPTETILWNVSEMQCIYKSFGWPWTYALVCNRAMRLSVELQSQTIQIHELCVYVQSWKHQWNFSRKLVIASFILSWTSVPKGFCHKADNPWSLTQSSFTEHVIILKCRNGLRTHCQVTLGIKSPVKCMW